MTQNDELLKGYSVEDSRAPAAPSGVLCRTEACEMELNIGVFADGTGNNWDWVEEGHTLNQLERQKDSNVHRLFKSYREDPLQGYFRIYMPGVGTPFDAVGEDEASSFYGMALGEGGDRRVNFALLGVLNAVYRALTGNKAGKSWLSPASVKALCRNGRRQEESGRWKRWPEGDAPILQRLGRPELGGLLGDDESRREFLRQQFERLGKLVVSSRRPKIRRIALDVFGFSRGAAEARVFCTWLGELMPDGKLCGVPAVIRFLGIFDTVASVGRSEAYGSDGHADWATAANLRIGPHVKRCVHYVAMHEQRGSFPLDSVRNPDGSYPSNCEQWMFPGMHSDVGGGYTPQEHGRGPDRRDSQKLSQIPLNRMYRAARAEGVPLDKGLAQQGPHDPFAIDPALQQAFDAFMKVQSGPPRRLRDWLKPYLAWRYQHRYTYIHQDWAKRCPAEDKNLLVKANKEFIDDLGMFELQRAQPDWFDPTDPQNAGITVHDVRESQGALRRSLHPVERRALPDEASEIFQLMRAAAPVSSALAKLFSDYVHDSYAGFTLALGLHEYTGYLHYRRQYMGNDKALSQLVSGDNGEYA